MFAIVVNETGGPEMLRMMQVPEPRPAAGQVVIQVRAAGVNPVETYQRSGVGAHPELPFTPGTDAAGIIAEVGAGVDTCRVGERVYTSGALGGTYAERALCAASQVHPLPDGMSFAEGAALGVPYGTAWRALFQRAGAARGETVLIHGASGGVGIAATQLASAAGLRVIGTASSEDGRRLALAQGAAHAFDHSDESHWDAVLAVTGGEGVALILEMLSNANLGRDLTILAKHGRVVCIGNRGPGNHGTVLVDPRELMLREATVLGLYLPGASSEESRAIYEGLDGAMRAGTIHPVIVREYALSEAARAHQDLALGARLGKLVLVP